MCSWRCRIWVDILRCFAGGWPRAFCSSVVEAAAASCCSDSMTHHTDVWLRPTNAAKPLFHVSSGRRRSAWRHARLRWTPGTAATADAAWCAEQRRRRRRRQPLQQVASSVCSLSASSTSVTQSCSCMPSTTSDSGRKAPQAFVMHRGEIFGCAKEAGGNARRRCVRGECPVSQ